MDRMDPFEVRMQFLDLIRNLNASQSSIAKVVRFAMRYFAKCGEDIWDCVVEECDRGSVNARINILYMLDSLCEASNVAKISRPPQQQSSSSSKETTFYVDYVSKDLTKIVDMVVPERREGLTNFTSAAQILQSWRDKRILDSSIIDEALELLEKKRERLTALEDSSSSTLTKQEVIRRVEEDRERHKRLRERRWVQPIPPPQHSSGTFIPPLASFQIPEFNPELRPEGSAYVSEDLEFENAWETTSDWNEDDDDDVKEENSIYYACVMEDGKAPRGRSP